MKRRLNDPPPIRSASKKVTEPAAPPAKKQRQKKPKNSGQRWQMFNVFVDQIMHELLPAQRAVWLVLFRDERNSVAKTGQSDIAKRCGLSRESVNRAIAELESRGLIKTLHQGGINRGSSWYQVLSKN
tara:strand:+ start:6696 stop:7079 length:384 start_codon:yes stop_codon:yes gene_type:complete